MYFSEFPLTMLPASLRHKVKFKKYKKGDYIFEQGTDNIIYLKSGKAIKIRCDDDDEKIFPYMFSGDEFVGVNSYFKGIEGWDWEVMAFSDEVEGYEIPTHLFRDYILSTPLFTQEYLPKCTKIISQGLRGFYIYSQGGAVPYFAYILLNYFCENSNVFYFDSYSYLTKAVYVNKSTLYKITNQFIEEGLMEKNKHNLKILNRKALKKYYESYKY